MANLLVQEDPNLNMKRQLAMAMMQRGRESAQQPMRHWSQSAASLADSLIGAYQNKQATDQQNKQNEEFRARVAGATDYDQLAGALAGTDSGLQMQMQEIERKKAAEEHQRRRTETMDDKKEFEIFKAENNVGPDSMTMKEFKFYQKLPPEDQAQFMNLKRAAQIMDLGGEKTVLDPTDPTKTTGSFEKGIAPQDTVEHKVDVTRATEETKNQVEAASRLGPAGQKAQSTVDIIDTLLQHPGKEAAVGFSSIANIAALPGGDRKDFLVKLDQAKGKVFAEAYETLKGGGQITEFEGQKAEQALVNMDTAQSQEQFDAALIEFKDAVIEGYAKLEEKAGVTPGQTLKGSGGQMNRGRRADDPKPTAIDWNDL